MVRLDVDSESREVEKIMLEVIRKYSGSERDLQRSLRRSAWLAGSALGVAVTSIGFLTFQLSGNLALTVAAFAVIVSVSVVSFVALGMAVNRTLDSMLKLVVRTFLDKLGTVGRK